MCLWSIRLFAFMWNQYVLCNATYSCRNDDLFPFAVYDHPHTLVTSLSCGCFFSCGWTIRRVSQASKVLLCAAFVACFQAIKMKQCGLVSGHSSDKRCLSKPSSPSVYINHKYWLVLMKMFPLNNVKWITYLGRHWNINCSTFFKFTLNIVIKLLYIA